MNKKVLHTVIDQVSESCGNTIAIKEQDRNFTYAALKEYSNRIGHTLVDIGIHKGDVIGVYLGSGIEYISSILGINKSGGIFMPLELSYPAKRLEYLLGKVSPRVIITQVAYVEDLLKIYKEAANEFSLDTIILVSGDHQEVVISKVSNGVVSQQSSGSDQVNPIGREIDGDDSNYLIYTSGSTGEPKIIEGNHKSLSHFMHWEKGEFGLDDTVRVSQLAPLSFDASLRDIFVPLISGGCVCIPIAETKRNMVSLLHWIGEHKITMLHTVPSLFRQLVKTLKENESLQSSILSLQNILLAGEPLYGKDIVEWRDVAGKDGAVIVNLYGPSETTLIKTYYRVEEEITDPLSMLPIGKPISNTVVLILSEGEVCNTGNSGEIYIRTPFRTKGYYQDEKQTASCFVQNPLNAATEDIVYKTGDIGRYLKDGNIEFVGRVDSQVKIRGNRVELSEVERAVKRYVGIDEVIITTVKSENDDNLACYFTADRVVEESALRRYLADYLPDYMHPSYFISMEEFPLNINGKIDKKQLPKPEEVLRKEIVYEKTVTPTEDKLEAIWKEILHVDLIGRKASFFQLGGTSLKAIQIISRIYKEFNTLISIGDIFTHPIIEELAVVVEQSIKSAYKQVPLVSQQDTYEMSHSQKTLWTQHQVSGSLAYHMLGGCYLEDLDREAFEKAFNTLIARHESLRTSFVSVSGEPRQKIHAAEGFNFQILYCDLRTVDDRDVEIAHHVNMETSTPFNLETGPLIRSRLLALDDNRHLFLFNMHHIISDGWSVGILVKEILALYTAYQNGMENPLGPLRIQYKDYAAWQNSLISDSETSEYKSYWHEKLLGDIPALKLPVDFDRPETRTYEGDKYVINLSGPLSDKIRKLNESTESSLFIFFLTILNLELYHLSDEKDIFIGSPVAGRSHTDLENQIGTFLNYLILRNRINRNFTFKEFLINVKKETLKAYNYQEYPYERLVDELKPVTQAGRNPFFDVLLVMNNALLDSSEMDQLNDVLKVSDFGIEDNTSKLDLSFFVNDDSEISIEVEYSTELYKRETIARIEEDIRSIINTVLQDPECSLGDIVWELSGASRKIQDLAVQVAPSKILHNVIDSQANKLREKIAIEEKASTITYGDLTLFSNRIGHSLLSRHIEKGAIVGVYLKGGIDYVCSILAVNKAGGVFMPLELSYPAKRLEYLLGKASPRIIITSEPYLEDLLGLYRGASNGISLDTVLLVSHEQADIQIVNISEGVEEEREAGSMVTDPLELTVNGDDSNYLIYTSGSTGLPKIIEGSHKGLSHFMHWEKKEFSLDEQVRVVQLAPLTFDASFRDIFVPLISGGCLYIPDRETRGNTVSLIKWIGLHKISLLHTVPSLFRQITRTLKENVSLQSEIASLKSVLLAGEPLFVKDIQDWKRVTESRAEIVNLYGPSETTLIKTYYRVSESDLEKDPQSMLPIGKPISNTAVLIISDGDICNIGSSGEIHIKTPFRTKGYFLDPTQTNERFIQNPFNTEKEDILYNTGDIGRYLEDGNIEFVGRDDNQIKISGNRVELSEIERTVKGCAGIDEVVVLALKSESENILVCYFISDPPVEENTLRAYVQRYLPDYMHPAYYISLGEFPLNINGKIDKKQFPKPEEILRKEIVYEKPVTVTEEKLEQIWKEVLRVDLIGRKVSFFQLGGTSLKAIQIISRVYKEFNTLIAIGDIFTYPSIEALAVVIDQSIRAAYSDIPLVETQDTYVLSHGQRRLWILDKLMPGDVSYNISEVLNFRGALDREAFEKSFMTLVERHESLRTVFVMVEGEPHQKVQENNSFGFALSYVDLRECHDVDTEISNRVQEESLTPFDLETGPLLRAQLLQRGEEEYVFLFTMHHIISDGWSMTVLVKEILTLYSQYSKGISASLPPLRIQYKDYASWQQGQLVGDRLKSHQEYWFRKLEDVPVVELPTDYTRPLVKTSTGRVHKVQLDDSLSKSIETLSAEKGVSLFTILVATVKSLLYKYTGQDDLVIGTPILGRDHRDLEDQIGLYINMLALRTQLQSTWTFEQILNAVKDTVLGAYDHQLYPFDKLVDELNLSRDMSRMPLFDVMIVLQDFENSISVPTEEFSLSVSDYPKDEITSKYDLTFIFRPSSSGLYLSIEYNTDIFSHERIAALCDHYSNLLRGMMESPATQLGNLEYLTPAETEQQLFSFNNTFSDYPQDQTLQGLFEAQAADYPDALAIAYETITLTYRELNEQSNQLAHYLRNSYKIKKGDLVGLQVDRSEWMIISLLGILKSGAGYVPIDPDYPESRVSYIVNNASLKVVIADQSVRHDLDMAVITRSDWSLIAEAPSHNPENLNSPQDLAYVIYTSGSTGNPKGVMLEHAGVVNRIDWMWHQYNFSRSDVIFQKTTFTFDVSVWEIFMTLCYGSQLVLCRKEEIYDPERIAALIALHRITTLHFVPSMLSAFLDQLHEDRVSQLDSLRHVISSGEALPVATVRKHYEKLGIPLHNLYGPTEASVDVTYYPTSSTDVVIPIGKPIWNTKMYILDKDLNLLPLGGVGEIAISGIGLARGYMGLPEQTEASFKPNPFEEGSRLYLTGDLGRWRKDGTIEYLGRKDYQVKVKGYRIELGEIESTLLKHENISEAAVLAITHERETDLHAYYVLTRDDASIDFRSYLKEYLPVYMIPQFFVGLPSLPLNSNGKIDRKALLGIHAEPGKVLQYEAPATDLEKQIAAIWSDILGQPQIGATTSFFELGGHSLKAIRAVSQIHQRLEKQINLKDFFDYPTVRQQAKLLENRSKTAYRRIEPIAIQSYYELSHAQKRLWILDQAYGSLPYHMFGGTYIDFSLNLEIIEKVFVSLIERHESLRTTFTVVKGEPKQVIHTADDIDFKLAYYDFQLHKDQFAALSTLVNSERTEPFNLERGPLIRSKLVRLGEEKYFLMINLHHIISDGWSCELVVREILQLYKAYSEGKANPLKPLRIQYKDYAAWQNQMLADGEMVSQKNYWLNLFSGEVPKLNLPTDFVRPTHKSFKGDIHKFRIPEADSEAIRKICLEQNITLFMFLLSLVNMVLYKLSGQREIVIGSPIAGRNNADLEDQIGFYLNNLVLKNTIHRKLSFKDFLQKVKTVTLEAYENQDYPFDKLVEDLKLDFKDNANPLYDVLFVMNNTDLLKKSDANVSDEREEISVKEKTSKLDLSFFIDDSRDIAIMIEYSTVLFKNESIIDIQDLILDIASLVIENIDLSIGDIINDADSVSEELLGSTLNSINDNF